MGHIIRMDGQVPAIAPRTAQQKQGDEEEGTDRAQALHARKPNHGSTGSDQTWGMSASRRLM